MQIWTPTPTARDEGEFDVRLNTAGARPFAVIALSENRLTALTLDSPVECDRLARAAVLAKSMLLGETSDPARVPLDIVPDSDDAGTARREAYARLDIVPDSDDAGTDAS